MSPYAAANDRLGRKPVTQILSDFWKLQSRDARNNMLQAHPWIMHAPVPVHPGWKERCFLHAAFERCDLGLVAAGISAGLPLEVKDRRGELTVLQRLFTDWQQHDAQRFEVIKQAIAKGADCGAVPLSGLPIWALDGSDGDHWPRDLTALLIERGAPVEGFDSDGTSCLAWLVELGRVDCVTRFVEAGADVNAGNRRLLNQYPLAKAVELSNDAVLALIENGARRELTDHLGRTFLHVVRIPAAVPRLLTLGLDTEARDRCRRTALQDTLSRQHFEYKSVAAALINAGADIDAPDLAGDGGTPRELILSKGDELAGLGSLIRSMTARAAALEAVSSQPSSLVL